jgi:hypothetical protein
MTLVEYTGKRGRPSKYAPMLTRIQGTVGWHIIDRNQANRTQPSQLRVRYPGYDFKCERNQRGKFNLLARWVGGTDE